MRYHTDEEWAFLRIGSASAFTAATFASIPGVNTKFATAAFCYARSQLGYIVGETTEFSYVHGFGDNFVTQVHHRDSVCTLEEDKNGDCVR
jgi:Glycosyl hydrolase family 9